MTNKICFTGSLGAGKTSVFEGMNLGDILKIPEVARYWLDFTNRNALKHYRSPDFFQQLIEIHHIENLIKFDDKLRSRKAYNTHQFQGEPTKDYLVGIFDRTLPDEIAYRNFFNQEVPETLIADCNRYRVDKVFIFPYWAEIYKNDKVRIETPAEAEHLDKLIIEAYKLVGYEPIIVPKTSIEERIAFIYDKIL